MDPENKKYMSKILDFSALGLEMGACVVIGVWLGMLADKKWGVAPWGIVLGTIFGVGAMVSSLFKAIKRARKYEQEDAGDL